MKKLFLFISLFFLTLSGMAQEHLSFKGIPIEGSLNEFSKKLEKKGLQPMGTKDNISYFSGDFTGKSAIIGVSATDNGMDVYGVAVMFDPSDSWKSLVATYDYLKELYTEKYGAPCKSLENNPSSLDLNSSLMNELYQGRVTYNSLFEAPGGVIQLSISNYEYDSGTVIITYMDTKNITDKRQKDMDDI